MYQRHTSFCVVRIPRTIGLLSIFSSTILPVRSLDGSYSITVWQPSRLARTGTVASEVRRGGWLPDRGENDTQGFDEVGEVDSYTPFAWHHHFDRELTGSERTDTPMYIRTHPPCKVIGGWFQTLSWGNFNAVVLAWWLWWRDQQVGKILWLTHLLWAELTCSPYNLLVFWCTFTPSRRQLSNQSRIWNPVFVNSVTRRETQHPSQTPQSGGGSLTCDLEVPFDNCIKLDVD